MEIQYLKNCVYVSKGTIAFIYIKELDEFLPSKIAGFRQIFGKIWPNFRKSLWKDSIIICNYSAGGYTIYANLLVNANGKQAKVITKNAHYNLHH